MKKNKLSCFLPCRKGSERVERKNIKPFAGNEYGLIQVKLYQLLGVKSIDEIVLSTNDDEILSYVSGLNESRIRVHNRVEDLSSSATSTDSLVAHALDLIGDGDILWTHVTSPFIRFKHYEKIIEKYYESLDEGYDSLMTTTELYSFLWQGEKPLNYDRKLEKWPRTQTLKPIHEINSGAFIASTNIYKQCRDRIGYKPLLYPLGKLVGHDIDWPEDFAIAECLVEKGLLEL
ncbi:cytidylyltransferase domain-containing protein [Reinekea marina]|uniref:Cytidylyltransferase domain-containing protein n=1 Tax=Reinekea marina TaxID=1310421 RepID=A0ABV7WUG5_9GAMM